MNIHNDEICNKSKIFDIPIIQNDEIGKKIRQIIRQTRYQPMNTILAAP